MKKVIFLAGLVSLLIISSLVTAETKEPNPVPEQVIADLGQVAVSEFDPAAKMIDLLQPETCDASASLGSTINPICITCTTMQECAFACGSSGSCFPDFFSLCGGPPTRNICYCA